MNRTKLITALAAILVSAALVLAEDSTEVAKAVTTSPYLTDAAQAKAEAAESGRYALIDFYSPT